MSTDDTIFNSVHAVTSGAQTAEIAKRVAGRVEQRMVIALHGELGAGKTYFTRCLVEALGGDGRMVSSPTYTLLHVYPTPVMQVFHIDAYRTQGDVEVSQLGFDEILDEPGLVLIEWAERCESLLPSNTLHVYLQHVDDGRGGQSTSRLIRLERRR